LSTLEKTRTVYARYYPNFGCAQQKNLAFKIARVFGRRIEDVFDDRK
jgi:type IV pilus biogenesis protein CpaD/CtpE